MDDSRRFDAAVVGGGPNGLAAAIVLAGAGLKVVLYESAPRVGGGLSSDELTAPGFTHDLCSAIHPLAAASPFLRTLPLSRFGLEWVQPALPYAHPLDGGRAAVAHVDLDETAAGLGEGGRSWRRLFKPLAKRTSPLFRDVLRPIIHMPRNPLLLARFGLPALLPARVLAGRLLKGERAQALFAGMAGHSLVSFSDPGSSAIALMLGAAGHALGWPFPRGGAQRLADALAGYFEALGGTIITGRTIESLDELRSRVVMLDVTPQQLLQMAAGRIPDGYGKRLEAYRYGPGVFKMDFALREPVPWAAPACREAGTVHLGGTLEEIAAAEDDVAHGRIPDAPYVLTAQHSHFDATRAPGGKHTFWAYCHVPNGSTVDMSDRIIRQIERFAPGFRDCIIAQHTAGPADMQRRNPNLIGGDINGGAASLIQLLARPVLSPTPYRTPMKGVYLCSASTPPGGGVHGMCGYNAARLALKDIGAARSA